MRLSAAGVAALDEARPHISNVTARLVGSIPSASVEIMLQVLDEVRSNAELELAILG